MHYSIESYLDRVKSHLKSLSLEEQDLQIQELRVHLEILTEEKIALGLTEREAANAAISQFGEPSSVGRGLHEVAGGRKTGLVHGLIVGSALGATAVLVIAAIQWLLSLATAAPSERSTFTLAFIVWMIPGGLGGAVASLVGRRFTRRYLTRPAKLLPIFTQYSQALAVAYRTMTLGIFRGAVGGAVAGVLSAPIPFCFPDTPMISKGDFVSLLLISTSVYAMCGVVIVGLGGAIYGAVLGARSQRNLKSLRN